MKNILVIIVLILVVIAIYNVFVFMKQGVNFGGIGSLFKLPYTIPKEYQGSTSSAPGAEGISTAPPQTNQNNSNNTQSPPQPTFTPPTGFTADQLSPYYGQVRISGVSAAGSWNGVAQFSLQADGSIKKGIDVTGWQVKSNKGDLIIPGAVENYTPGGFASSGDIVLTASAYGVFYSSASPIGKNLRINACIGFLNNIYQFSPSLPTNCPSVYDRSEIATLSGQCQNLIFSLGGCSVPTPAQWNSMNGEPACLDFLNRFSYTSCYWKHVNDANFFSNEWRSWLGSPFYFDSSHDRILLLDRSGLLVDQYIY